MWIWLLGSDIISLPSNIPNGQLNGHKKSHPAHIDSLLELNHQITHLHHHNSPHVFNPPSPADKDFLLNALQDEQRLFLVSLVDKKSVRFLDRKHQSK